jgi:hypothetical protein
MIAVATQLFDQRLFIVGNILAWLDDTAQVVSGLLQRFLNDVAILNGSIK